MDSGKVKFDYAQHTIDRAKRDLPKEADTIDLVIAAIEYDISDRGGIKHEWAQIEQNIIDNEIKPMWKSILTKLVVDKAERDGLKQDLRMVRESQERQRQLNDKLTLERDGLKGKLGKAVDLMRYIAEQRPFGRPLPMEYVIQNLRECLKELESV